jgi:hypothetical protein
LRIYWSHPPTRADILALGKQGRRVRLVQLFTPPHRRLVRTITLSTSLISKLRAADDERRQAKRNSLAEKLTVETKAPRRPQDREGHSGGRAAHRRGRPGPGAVSGDADRCRQRDGPPMVHSRGCAVARPGRCPPVARGDTKAMIRSSIRFEVARKERAAEANAERLHHRVRRRVDLAAG